MGALSGAHVPTPDAPIYTKYWRHDSATNLRWTMTQLDIALDASNTRTKIIIATHDFGIPVAPCKTTISRKRGNPIV